MEKEIIKYRGNEGHSDITVYKFDNTEQDQTQAQNLLVEGKSRNMHIYGPTLQYIVPQGVPLNTYYNVNMIASVGQEELPWHGKAFSHAKLSFQEWEEING